MNLKSPLFSRKKRHARKGYASPRKNPEKARITPTRLLAFWAPGRKGEGAPILGVDMPPLPDVGRDVQDFIQSHLCFPKTFQTLINAHPKNFDAGLVNDIVQFRPRDNSQGKSRVHIPIDDALVDLGNAVYFLQHGIIPLQHLAEPFNVSYFIRFHRFFPQLEQLFLVACAHRREILS